MFLSGEYRIKLYLKRSLEAYQAGLTKEAYIGFMRVVLRETREQERERDGMLQNKMRILAFGLSYPKFF